MDLGKLEQRVSELVKNGFGSDITIDVIRKLPTEDEVISGYEILFRKGSIGPVSGITLCQQGKEDLNEVAVGLVDSMKVGYASYRAPTR